VVLGDDAEPLSLPNPVGPTILSADDLTGDFRYWAVDAGTTPMSDLTKQQALERLVPLLVQLGADPAQVLGELVRTYQLPESFAAAEMQPMSTPEGVPEQAAPEQAAPEQVQVAEPVGLNGAQVSAFMDVLKSVSEGTIGSEAAFVTLQSAFPGVPPDSLRLAIESQKTATVSPAAGGLPPQGL
jgi:hypothetical protein